MNKTLLTLIFLCLFSGNSWADATSSCKPPYDPTNVVESTLRYSEAMEYIAEGPEGCSRAFADQFIEVFRDSWLVSDGCLKVTIEDVNAALTIRESVVRKSA